ncbi:Sir2 family NAD-dependent protein deacetylase [Pseudomonadales bacterium]|nr:Sir2 family NAD-dependent protein deacetylase [Pseudomonadales bacterium]
MLKNSNAIVFFTGAGISTESGIPDFRSPGTGLWTKMQPIQFQDFMASEEMRLESWERKFGGDQVMLTAQPNEGHNAIVALDKIGKCSGLITQNVDNLHQNSGLAEEKIVELHGNATYASCLSCTQRYDLDELKVQFERDQSVAPCFDCGGIIKTATISFGQSMPEVPMQRATSMVEACDLMIVLGSSLTVYPAAGFPEYAKQLGAKLVIINRDETGLDGIADLVIQQQIGTVMQQANQRLHSLLKPL